VTCEKPRPPLLTAPVRRTIEKPVTQLTNDVGANLNARNNGRVRPICRNVISQADFEKTPAIKFTFGQVCRCPPSWHPHFSVCKVEMESKYDSESRQQGGNELSDGNPESGLEGESERLKQPVPSPNQEPRRWKHAVFSANQEWIRVPVEHLTTYDGIAQLFVSRPEECPPTPKRLVEGDVAFGPDECPIDWHPVYYGPSSRPEPTPDEFGHTIPVVKKQPAPDNQLIEYHDRRVLSTTMQEFVFPYLDFVGFWNISRVSSERSVFAKHFGFHLHQRNITVSLPSSLVKELAAFWAHKHRDDELKEFAVSAAKCRKMCTELGLTAQQQLDAVMYAPALAYIKYWDQQQNISRVVEGSYAHVGAGETVRKVSETFRNSKWVRPVMWFCVTLFLLVLVCSNVHFIEPELSTTCFVVSHIPHFTLAHPLTLRRQDCMIDHATSLWLIDRHDYDQFLIRVGCTRWSFDYAWYTLSVDEPTCSGYYRDVVLYMTRAMLNKLMHALNGNIVTVSLVNCARLPKPKQLKPGASIELRDGDLRGNLRYKDPECIRGVQRVYGFDTESYAPTAFASNQHNEEQALYARVLADTIQPTDDLDACLSWCKMNMRVLFPKMFSIKSVSFAEYISRSNASPSVKQILIQTMKGLESNGIDENSNLSKRELASFTTRSSFVKVENNLYNSPLGRKDKAPRLIQGATPQFICLVGPWIMACQDLLKRRWGTNNNLCFTSGIPSEQLANFVDAATGPIVEDDLGKFDCSIRKQWCEFEVWLCRQFGAPRAVLLLMKANISTHGYTHHGWFYKCEGTRKSGDPYTSLMNSIINGLSHLYLYCKWTGRTVVEARKTIFMLLQGDDNLLRHSDDRVFPWQEGMAGLGFDSEATYRGSLEEAEFCSNRLYRTMSGYVFGPKPGKVLAKFGYIINPPSNVSMQSMMRGVALGLEKNCHFIPPIKVVIDRVLELTAGHTAYYQRGFQEHVLKVRERYSSTVEIELSLSDQYGWSTHMQCEFSKTVRSLELGDAYADAFADLLFDRDTSGPQRIFGSLLGA